MLGVRRDCFDGCLYLSLSVTQVNILTRVVVNNLYDQRKGCAHVALQLTVRVACYGFKHRSRICDTGSRDTRSTRTAASGREGIRVGDERVGAQRARRTGCAEHL